MKNLKINFWMMALALVFMVAATGCSQEEGMGGNYGIAGKVMMSDGTPVPYAFIHIAYGATEATTTFDKTCVADANGEYLMDGLQKGNYYVDADYTDENGFVFNSGGYTVTLEDKSENLTLDITLE